MPVQLSNSEYAALVNQRDAAQSALALAKRLCDEALPKFNWGASALDANAIQLLNEVPAAIASALNGKDIDSGALTSSPGEQYEMIQDQSNAPVAAIAFALDADEGMEWLRCWNEGDFDACRNEWPETPEACFIGADPLHPETRIPVSVAQVKAETRNRAMEEAARFIESKKPATPTAMVVQAFANEIRALKSDTTIDQT